VGEVVLYCFLVHLIIQLLLILHLLSDVLEGKEDHFLVVLVYSDNGELEESDAVFTVDDHVLLALIVLIIELRKLGDFRAVDALVQIDVAVSFSFFDS